MESFQEIAAKNFNGPISQTERDHLYATGWRTNPIGQMQHTGEHKWWGPVSPYTAREIDRIQGANLG